MQDQYIILDKTFDQHATYTLISWIAPVDTYVTRGEAIAIMQNDDTQLVVVAPCSGRIAATYIDTGARVLPRSIIGSIRPDANQSYPLVNMNTIAIAFAIILMAIIIIPVITQLRARSTVVDTTSSSPAQVDTSMPQPTQAPTTGDNTSAPLQSLQDFFQGADNSDSYPAPSQPVFPDPTTNDISNNQPSEPIPEAPLPTAADESLLSDGSSNLDLTNDLLYYLDYIHTVNLENRDLLASPVDVGLFDSDIMPAYTDVLQQQEELNVLADKYRNDPTLNDSNGLLLSFYPSWISPCLTPFAQQQRYVYEGVAPDSDMQVYFDECDKLVDYIKQYTPNQ